ncbi:MAG: two-component system response regulator [Deltaproteobacteria bacterium]|nr:MAG: two-component system response regulator [Deltaproteobacteria bacterium]
MSKILVVDDSQADRTNLENILKKAGYSTAAVEDGAKAVEAAKSNRPDLIMMDVNMPGMDGFAATRELKNNPDTKELPVVLVTSKDQKADKAWGKMLGAKGYITKPYTESDVLDVVKSL